MEASGQCEEDDEEHGGSERRRVLVQLELAGAGEQRKQLVGALIEQVGKRGHDGEVEEKNRWWCCVDCGLDRASRSAIYVPG